MGGFKIIKAKRVTRKLRDLQNKNGNLRGRRKKGSGWKRKKKPSKMKPD